MRTTEDGEKWERLKETWRTCGTLVWAQGKERFVCSLTRGSAITHWKVREVTELVGCH